MVSGNDIRDGDRGTDPVDPPYLFFQDKELVQEFRVCRVWGLDKEDIGVLPVAVVVEVVDNTRGRLFIHVLVGHGLGRDHVMKPMAMTASTTITAKIPFG